MGTKRTFQRIVHKFRIELCEQCLGWLFTIAFIVGMSVGGFIFLWSFKFIEYADGIGFRIPPANFVNP